MNQILLITGLMASGKSTVAQRLSEKLPCSVHLRGDIFRRMIVNGREDMKEGAGIEAVDQLRLRYRLTASAACMYWEAGFDVIVQDNYYGAMLPYMLSLLDGLPVNTVVLCPSVECIIKREKQRSKKGYTGFAVQPLYDTFMRETPRIGLWLDSTEMTIDETTDKIIGQYFGI